MATITRSIGSAGGRDYATIAAWWAAIPSNLVTADEQWIGELYNDSTFTEAAVALSGKTTDATRNIILRCAAGQSFKHNASKLTNALRYNAANGVAYQPATGDAVTITGNMHLEINGLQVLSGGNGFFQTNSGANVRIVDSIAQAFAGGTGTGAIVLFNGRAINCLAVETAGGTACLSNGGSANFHNVTAVQMGAATAFGFRGNYDAPVCTNCVAVGFGTNFRAGVTGNYNASSQASPPGANSVGSITASDQFENIAGAGTMDFRLKGTASIRNLGTRDQTYTNDLDILGQARSTSVPSIGAYEYVSGGGGGSTLLAKLNHFMRA